MLCFTHLNRGVGTEWDGWQGKAVWHFQKGPDDGLCGVERTEMDKATRGFLSFDSLKIPLSLLAAWTRCCFFDWQRDYALRSRGCSGRN